MITATVSDPLNVNDATMRVPEQPLGWCGGGGTVASVAFSVGHFGLIAVPLAMGATSTTDAPRIAEGLTATTSGADQFAQCRVLVVLRVVVAVGGIDVERDAEVVSVEACEPGALKERDELLDNVNHARTAQCGDAVLLIVLGVVVGRVDEAVSDDQDRLNSADAVDDALNDDVLDRLLNPSLSDALRVRGRNEVGVHDIVEDNDGDSATAVPLRDRVVVQQ
jgi:hypothetical protein